MENSFLTGNLELLKRLPALNSQMLHWQKNHRSELYTVENAKTGLPTLTVRLPDERTSSYHSRYDPVKEAVRQVETAYEGQTHVLLLGFGLGYMTEEILKRLPQGVAGPQVFVVEPDPGVFYSALQSRDLSSLLKNPRIVWCVGMTPDQIGDFWNTTLDWTVMEKLAIIDHPPSMARFKQNFERVVEKIRYLCNKSKGNLVTLMHAGFEFHSNYFANLAQSFTMPGIGRLFDKFKGVPVIIVAAGPSLDKNIHLLKQIKGKFPIIAVDTAFRQLIANQIKPDIVCAADPSYENSLDFVGVEDVSDVVLALEPMTHPDIFNSFKGPRMVMTFGGGLYPIMKDYRESVGTLVCWGSIATTVFDLAVRTGADPLVFVGLDLSFADGRLHARGSYSDDLLYEKVHAYNSIEHETADYIATRGAYKLVKPDGTVLYTDRNMKLYKDWFEDQFRQTGCKIINATEGGAVDRFVELMSFEQVMQRYADKSVDVAGILHQALTEPVKADVKGLLERLSAIRKRISINETTLRRSVSQTRKILTNNGRNKPEELTGTNRVEFFDVLKAHDELCGDREIFPWLSIHQAKFITRHIMQVNGLKADTQATVSDWLDEISQFFAALDKFHQYQMPLLDKALASLQAGRSKNLSRGECFPDE
ncbi:MAG: 6-hydroxymethylpterin diphosphokinase MptE-like protein [Candidatus Riflebacteria bacterium]